MSDTYSSGVWGDAPRVPDAATLERRRFERPASGDARARAVVGEALDWFSPVLIGEAWMGLENSWDVYRTQAERAAGRDAPFNAGQVLSPERANDLYGIEGSLSFDEPVTARWAAHRFERTQRELTRADVIARAEDGNALTDFGLSVAVGLADPINWALPLGRINALRTVAPRLAAWETGEAMAPRMLARGLFGAAEGGAWSLALEPGYYGLASLAERDYDLRDSLINVVAGAGFGGVLGSGSGLFTPEEVAAERALLPREARAASSEARAAAAMHAAEAVAEGRPVEAGRVFEATALPRFETADGVRFRVGEHGATVREGAMGAAAHSFETFYLAPEDATRLAAAQAAAGVKRSIVSEGDFAALRFDEGPQAGATDLATMVGLTREPAVGLVPVELGRDGEVRIGKAITRVWRRGEASGEAARHADAPDETPARDQPYATPREIDGERTAARDAVAGEIEADLAPRYGEDAKPMARVAANMFANIAGHYGETAREAAAAINFQIDDAHAGGAGRRFAQAARRARAEIGVRLAPRAIHKRAIARADKAVRRAERQSVAFLAAAECIAREGFGVGDAAELMAGQAIGAAIALPAGFLTAINMPKTPEAWLTHVREVAAQTLDLDAQGYLDAPAVEPGEEGESALFAGHAQERWNVGDDPDWSAPGRNDWEAPEEDDTPGEASGLLPSGAKVPPAPPGLNEAPPEDAAEAQALIEAFEPILDDLLVEPEVNP